MAPRTTPVTAPVGGRGGRSSGTLSIVLVVADGTGLGELLSHQLFRSRIAGAAGAFDRRGNLPDRLTNAGGELG
jgi:hypothetical protein